MIFSLSPQALAQFYRLEVFDIVESTNDLAAEFAKSGDSGRLWIVAAEQTGGRGRRGRVWHSPKGNLYASLLLTEDFAPEQAAQLGFVAGVALREALAELLPEKLQKESGIFLKWPNDVLIGKAKLAGILPEFITRGSKAKQRKNAIIIGMGVNVKAAPAVENTSLYPIANLAAWDKTCSPPAVFAALSRFWAENYALWNNGQGMAALRDKWLCHAAFRGEIIHLNHKGAMLSGVFAGIDDFGRLILVQENGEKQLISAGDVYFGAAAKTRPK